MTTTPRKPTVSFRDTTVEATLAGRTDTDGSLGLTARRTLTRYFDALAREQGRLGLTGEEWTALKAATISRYFDEQGPYYLHYGVLDAVESGDLQDTDPAIVQSLVVKLKALTPLQEIALIDLLEGWRLRGE